jgi:hypothetical protein
MLDEYLNRKKYTELTPEIIASIEDRWLELALLDFIDYKVGQNHQEFESILASLGPAFEATYYVNELAQK